MSTVIDLSHPVEPGMITYPGLPGPSISDHLSYDESRSHYAPGVEFRISRTELLTATGTYLDAPAHRFRGKDDIAALPLDKLVNLPGVVITAGSYAIDPQSISGLDIRGHAVLFHTGWDSHWGKPAYGGTDHAYVTHATAQALIAGGATLVGIDTVNIDDNSNRSGGERPAHSTLLAAGVPIVENLRALGDLGERPFRFFAAPIAFRGAVSFSIRAFAICD